jgi:ureidoacrylate peracid hydrolase
MANTAFVILDLQNDSCHVEGAFHKNGLDTSCLSKIIPNIVNTIYFCKNNNIPIIAVQHTILENKQKEAIGLGVYKKIFPFINNEGLREGSWGYDLLDEIKNDVDYKVKRWNMSSFYHTELARYLGALRINQLVLSGFTTNGIVETTAREGAARNYQIITLSNCTTSYSDNGHRASLANINTFGEVFTSADWQDIYSKG